MIHQVILQTLFFCTLFIFTAKRYPIYGSQFHPEKISYTWDIHDKINHSRGAVRLEQYFANFFVNEGILVFYKKCFHQDIKGIFP